MPAGVNYDFLMTSLGDVNDAGQVALVGSVTGPGVNSQNFSAIWAGVPGNIALVARQSDQALGAPDGVAYSQLYIPPYGPRVSLNAPGQVAFAAILTGQWPPNSLPNIGIFAGAPGAVRMVLRSGDPAPGVPEKVISIESPLPQVRLNDRGDIAFFGFADDNVGIWAGQPDRVQLAALAGTRAPGTSDGVTFEAGTGNFRSLALAPSGAVAFAAKLSGTSTGTSGVWAGQPGAMHLIARSGDRIPGQTGYRQLVRRWIERCDQRVRADCFQLRVRDRDQCDLSRRPLRPFDHRSLHRRALRRRRRGRPYDPGAAIRRARLTERRRAGRIRRQLHGRLERCVCHRTGAWSRDSLLCRGRGTASATAPANPGLTASRAVVCRVVSLRQRRRERQ